MTESIELLDPAAFAAALQSARPPIVVDVRHPEAFALGHVPHSRNIPVHDLGRRRADLPASRAERLLVVGDHRRRTLAAARFLLLMGFGDVAVLGGGVAAYDGPLERGPDLD